MTFNLSRSKLKILYPFFKHTFSKIIQRNAEAFVAVGDASKVFMNKVYGIPTNNIKVIYMGADVNIFKFDSHSRSQIRNSYGISDDETLFIYTGKIIPLKKIHFLVEVAELLSMYKVRFLIIGSGVSLYIDNLKRSIKLKNLNDKFIWHDSVHNNELPKFYSAADAAIWPADASISMLEALSCGLPVIMSDSPNINEKIPYGEQLTYREGNLRELAVLMKEIISSDHTEDTRKAYQSNIQERISWENIAAEFTVLAKGI